MTQQMQRRPQLVPGMPTWGWVALAVGIAALIALGSLFRDDDSDGNERFSPREAACQMIDDGDTPDQAYRALVAILDDQPYTTADPALTARLAVDRAVAGDC